MPLISGYEFDVGIHYVGECANNTITHTLLDQITEGQLGFNPVEQEIDTIILTDPKRDGIRKIPLLSGKDVWKNKLKEMFPKEEKAIDEYFKQMRVRSFSSLELDFLYIISTSC